MLRLLERTQQRLLLADRALTSLSPLATLQRGYAIVADSDGKLLTDSAATKAGASIDVCLARGSLAATVKKIHQDKS